MITISFKPHPGKGECKVAEEGAERSLKFHINYSSVIDTSRDGKAERRVAIGRVGGPDASGWTVTHSPTEALAVVRELERRYPEAEFVITNDGVPVDSQRVESLVEQIMWTSKEWYRVFEDRFRVEQAEAAA